MLLSRILLTLALSSFVSTLTACGGGSDGDDKDIVPTGEAIADISFADNDGYFPLDKLQANGAFYTGSEPDFGLINPSFKSGDKQNSRWAIDGSASVVAGATLAYAMKIEGVNASTSAVENLLSNLNIDAQTGLLTQFCQGFPSCYDNQTADEEKFLVSVIASVVGGNGKLERSFVLRVRSNR